MLKKRRVLFLGLVVLAGSACVTPTHASSAPEVIISYVQAAGAGGAKDELIVIHNNGAVAADITNWCLHNRSGTAFACFTPNEYDGLDERLLLPAYSSAVAASYEYVTSRSLEPEVVDAVYEVASQSSGSLVGTNDVVALVNEVGEAVDAKAWTAAAPSGKGWGRVALLSEPLMYASSASASDWVLVAWPSALPDITLQRALIPAEPAPEELPREEPPTTTVSFLRITEVFPNAEGADAGHEFIELYNAHDSEFQSLDGLRLRIGLETPKWYTFPLGITVAPGAYFVVTDSDMGISLVNTHGGVQLYSGDMAVGERIEYESPKDGEAWALFDDEWHYTAIPTPGLANSLPAKEVESVKAVAELKPCASNQFRNPETGRCKLIAVATTPTPCKAGQERNPETNRCRTIAVAKEPTPCKEGQERNPETNRCRNIVKMSAVDYGVKGVDTQAGVQLSWYYVAAIVGVVMLVLGYAAWEWREELRAVWRKFTLVFAKK